MILLAGCGADDGGRAGAAPAPTAESAPHVGTEETVRVTGPTGKTVEVQARIDTGATGSSIDTELAKDLGFDLENAETVKVSSSLGTQERPVVTGRIELAGRAGDARLSVTDREDRSTRLRIGRRDLRGVHVVVGEDD